MCLLWEEKWLSWIRHEVSWTFVYLHYLPFFPAIAPALVLFCCVGFCCCYFYVAMIKCPVRNNSRGKEEECCCCCCCCGASFLQVWDPIQGVVLPIVGRWLTNNQDDPGQYAQRPVSQVIAHSVKLTATITVPFVWASSHNPWSSLDFIFFSREASQYHVHVSQHTMFPVPGDWLEGASNGNQLSWSHCSETHPTTMFLTLDILEYETA